MDKNLNSLSLTEALSGFKNKSFSSRELVEACYSRIAKVEPKLKAFVSLDRKEALQKAREADNLVGEGVFSLKPLLGMPISIKDNYCTKNVKTTASSNILKDYRPPYDATVVKKLEDAGAIMVGKTNMDAWAHGSSTETSDFFTTKNPWDLGKLPGGSSGGSAASVAADEVVASIGSETAGSIRQPASWCGIVGLKPTYGRVSRFGVIAMGSSLDSPGPMTKKVADAALLLEIISGADGLDATCSSRKVEEYTGSLAKKGFKNLKIGISDDYFKVAEKEVAKKVMDSLKVFEKAGVGIKKVSLFDPSYAIGVYTILQRSEVSSNLGRYDGVRYGKGRQFFGDEAKRRIMLGTYCLSAGYYDAYYLKAQKVRTLIIENFNKVFEDVDVVIGPTSPSTALPVGSSKDHPMFGEVADVLVEPSSIAGLPGINLPVGLNKEGLPIGMQIIGPQFSEALLISLADFFEKETLFYQNKPSL